MIESNFQSRMGIEIKRTDKKTFFKVSSRIWFICSGVTLLTSSHFIGGVETVGGGGLGFLELSTPSTLTNGGVQTRIVGLRPWSFPHFQHFSLALESVN
ncbi:hypothetical protein ACKUZO_000110 [Acinetobacter baumannii]